ncbi:MAG TPA: BMP family ABC transporter substrate-binding protein, partial [Bacillota bacterium]|nr:BMP family ABC transporter substrate-binding protein [Bacillota bacterium]
VAERSGVYWMSTDMDQASLAPDHVLAAQVYHWEKVVKAMIDYRAKGILGGKHLTLTFADGTLELRFNPKLVNRIPKAVLDRVEKTKQDIITGKLRVELPKPGGK